MQTRGTQAGLHIPECSLSYAKTIIKLNDMSTLLRQHAEQQFAEELHELKKNEAYPVPENWEMSPQSVVTYLVIIETCDNHYYPK